MIQPGISSDRAEKQSINQMEKQIGCLRQQVVENLRPLRNLHFLRPSRPTWPTSIGHTEKVDTSFGMDT